MIEQIRTDRLAQVMLVGVGFAAIFTFCVFVYLVYALLAPITTTMTVQDLPKISIFLQTSQGQSVHLWYRVVGQVTEEEEFDLQMMPDSDGKGFVWEKDLEAGKGDMIQLRTSNLDGYGIACHVMIDGLSWLTSLSQDECVLSGTVR